MKVGDTIVCWSHEEMIKEIYRYARYGVIVDEDTSRKNCLVVKEIRRNDYEQLLSDASRVRKKH